MAEFDSKGRRLVSIVRVLEYHGTDEWISKVLASSRIPNQGEIKTSADGKFPFPEGCSIKSGFVVWNIEEAVEEEPHTTLIPMPPGTIQ